MKIKNLFIFLSAAVFCYLVWLQPVFAANFIQAAGNTNAGSFVTAGINPAGAGNLIVACVSTISQTAVSVTDNKSNTYIKAAQYAYGGSEVSLFYTYNISAGVTAVTVNPSAWDGGLKVSVAEYDGFGSTDPLDKTSVNDNGYNGGANWTSGVMAASAQANELIIGCARDRYGVTTSFSPAANFIARYNQSSLFLEDQSVSSQGSYQASGSRSGNSGYAIDAIAAAFKTGLATLSLPIVTSFTASPVNIALGQTSVLSWNVSGNPAPAISLSGGLGQQAGSMVSVSPTVTTTYTLTATNTQGTASQSVTVSVSGAPTPTPTSAPDTQAPSVPAGLSASAASASQINLSWQPSSDNVGVAGYRIYRNGSLLANTAATSYQDTNLAASTLYSYTLAAYDAAGNFSAQSAAVAATTLAAAVATGTTAGPVIFFTDLTSGPKTGGENNNGVFVTIYGNNFGQNPTVTVGGGTVAQIKLQPSQYLWYQKMTVQLGPNAQSGNLVVNNSNGSSNGINFTVRSGNIYFVATSGSNANDGSFNHPWQTLLYARDHMAAGDTVYAMDGVSQTADDGQGWNTAFLIRGAGSSALGPMALVGYPGASVTIGNSSGSPAYGIRAVSSAAGYWVIANVTLTGLSGMVTSGPTAPAAGSSNWRIIGNEITCPNGNGESGCFATQNSSYIYMYGNNVHNTGVVNATAHYHGVYFSTDTNYVWFGFNTIAYARGCRGLQVHSSALGPGGINDPTGHDVYGYYIFNNLIHDTQCDGMILATMNPSLGPVEVYNNVIYNAGTGPNNPENSGGWTCINIDGMTSGGTPGVGTVEVYNNTVYNCGSFANPPYANARAAIMNGGNNPNLRMRIRNNLVYQLSAPYLQIYTSNSLIYGSNNLFFGQGAAPNTAYVANSVVADPQLVNTAANNFHITQSSPAKDVGISTTPLAMDFEGTPRPQTGIYDIGAYEYQSGYIPTPTPTPTQPDTQAPSVPAGLSASAISTSQINLSWQAASDNVGVAGYRIYRGGAQIGTSVSTSFQDTSLSPATVYVYTVAAYDSANNLSQPSVAASATTLAVLPIISNLTGSNTTATTTTIAWNTNLPTNGQVFYGTTAAYGSQSGLLDDINKTLSHSVTLSTLLPATAYHFRVTSTDALNNSTSSPDFTFTTLAVPVAAAPIITSFTASAFTIAPGNSVVLSWTVSNASTTILDQGVGPVSGNSVTLSPGQTTTYTLTATGLGGTATAQVTITVSATPAAATTTAPSIVSFVALPASIMQGQSLSLTWNVTGNPAAVVSINNALGAQNSNSVMVSPSQTITYTLTATNSAGTATAQVTVVVTAPPVNTNSGAGGGGAGTGGGGGVSGGGAPVVVFIPPAASLPAVAPILSGQVASLKLINHRGTFYLIKDGTRQGITNPGMLFSYGFTFNQAKMATEADIAIPEGPLLLPNDGSLVKSKEDKTVYLISRSQRHGFTSEKVFKALGFKFSSVLLVTNPELQKLPLGIQVNNGYASHFDGVDINDHGTIYRIVNQTRQGYPSMEIYNSWHIPGDVSGVVPANTLDSALPLGNNVNLRAVQ